MRRAIAIAVTLALIACSLPIPTVQPTRTAKRGAKPQLASTATIRPSPTSQRSERAHPTASSSAPTITVGPTVSISGCNLAFIADTSMPDGTTLALNSVFRKKWRVKNSGTCTWTESIRLVNIGGEKMGLPGDSEPVPETPPGETVELSVRMRVPPDPGNYRSDWRLCANGQCFGSVLYISIIALAPTTAPSPTSTKGPIPLRVSLYCEDIITKMGILVKALENAGRLCREPRLLDAEWKLTLAANMVIIKMMHQEFLEMEVPPEMTKIHEVMLSATSDFDKAMDYLAEGVDSFGAADIEKATELMTSGAEKLERATQMVSDYNAQFE